MFLIFFYCSLNLCYDRHASKRGYKQLIYLHLKKTITNAHASRGLCLCQALHVKCQLYFVQVTSKNVVNGGGQLWEKLSSNHFSIIQQELPAFCSDLLKKIHFYEATSRISVQNAYASKRCSEWKQGIMLETCRHATTVLSPTLCMNAHINTHIFHIFLNLTCTFFFSTSNVWDTSG